MNHSHDWFSAVKLSGCTPCLLLPVAHSLSLNHLHHDTQLALMQQQHRKRLSYGPVASE